jgi:hypothetical protein
MNNTESIRVPPMIEDIERETKQIGFTMGSEPRTGSLLRTLAAMKPAGRILELGTGTGIATAWLLAGMDPPMPPTHARAKIPNSISPLLELGANYMSGLADFLIHKTS